MPSLNDEDERVMVQTVFNLPPEFIIEVMGEEGYELSREEEEKLYERFSELRIYFEVNVTTGDVYALGVR